LKAYRANIDRKSGGLERKKKSENAKSQQNPEFDVGQGV
jgi:hypothetical protein